jgi:hypothetical protein
VLPRGIPKMRNGNFRIIELNPCSVQHFAHVSNNYDFDGVT